MVNRSRPILTLPFTGRTDPYSLQFAGGSGAAPGIIGPSGLSYDISNTWTVMTWFNAKALSGSRMLFELGDEDIGDDDNTIRIQHSGSTLRVSVVDSIGNGFPSKVFDYDSFSLTTDTWFQVVVTWLGSSETLLGYVNGSVSTPNKIVDDPNVSQTASLDKKLSLGRSHFVGNGSTFDGFIHSTAIWSTVLSSSEISRIYNNGNGSSGVDLTENSGSYTSSGSLQHWYRLGYDRDIVGKDFTTVATPIDLTIIGGVVVRAINAPI